MPKTRFLLYFAVLTFLGTLADAQLNFCNDSGLQEWIAIGYPVGNNWFSKGWFQLDSGDCRVLISGPLGNRYYYYYAHSGSGRFESNGDTQFCISDQAFTSGDQCGPSQKLQGFLKVDTGGSSAYTVSLSCDLCVEQQSPSSILISMAKHRQTLDWGPSSFGLDLVGWVTAAIGNGGLDVRVGITSDLSELQDALPGIVQASYDHDDDCGDKLKVHTVSLRPYGSSARVFAAAHYENWTCGPFGFKNRNFEQNGSGSVKLTPFVNNNNIGLSTELLDVNADGLLGGLLQNQIIGPWLMNNLRNVIPSSVSLGNVSAALPPELRRFRIDLTGLRFVDRGGGKLGLYCTARVQVSRQDADAVFSSLQRR